MIDCNWPQDKNGGFKKGDVDAYLMRMHLVVLTPNWIYYRPAESGVAQVRRMQYADPARPDLFQPSVRDKYKAYKKDNTWRPETYDADLAWSVELLKLLAVEGTPPPVQTTLGARLDGGGRAPSTYVYPTVEELRAAAPRLDACGMSGAARRVMKGAAGRGRTSHLERA
jgi:hypothetical protein